MAGWRRVLGVGRMDSEGSRRRIRAAVEAGANTIRGKPLPAAAVELRRHRAITQNLARHLRAHPPRLPWTPEDEALLGTLPDAKLARQLGRTVEAVRVRRNRLGIPSAEGRRVHWTDAADALVRRLPPSEAAWQLRCSLKAVYTRRWVLGTDDRRKGTACE